MKKRRSTNNADPRVLFEKRPNNKNRETRRRRIYLIKTGLGSSVTAWIMQIKLTISLLRSIRQINNAHWLRFTWKRIEPFSRGYWTKRGTSLRRVRRLLRFFRKFTATHANAIKPSNGAVLIAADWIRWPREISPNFLDFKKKNFKIFSTIFLCLVKTGMMDEPCWGQLRGYRSRTTRQIIPRSLFSKSDEWWCFNDGENLRLYARNNLIPAHYVVSETRGLYK